MISRLQDPFVVKTLGISIRVIFVIFLVPAIVGWLVVLLSINFTVTDSGVVHFLIGLLSTGQNIPNSLVTSLFAALPALFLTVAVSKDDATLLSEVGRDLLVLILIGLLLSVVLMVMLNPESQNQVQIFDPTATATSVKPEGPGVERIRSLLQVLQTSSTTYLTYLFLLLGIKTAK